METVRTRQAMLAAMDPFLHEGFYAFVGPQKADPTALMAQALAAFRENEGLSLLLPVETARAIGAEQILPLRWIELRVCSALDGVGLTAAVSARLAEHDIACNVIAALRHDHVFVPAVDAERALALLQALSKEA